MTNFQLKIIAITSMIIDHIGAIFFPQIYIFRFLGRIAFPIFAFLLAEGFYHTYKTEKFASYVKRMIIFSIISEVCFDIAFSNKIIDLKSQNVFITFTISLFLLYSYEEFKKKNKDVFIPILFFSVLSVILMTDYNFIGPLIIFMFYKSIKSQNKIITVFAIISMIIYEYIIVLIEVSPALFINAFYSYAYVFMGILLALPIILLYNGKLGKRNKFIKYFFYFFYPVHLLILSFI